MNVGVISYGLGAVVALALTVLLVIGWRGRVAGTLLVVATAVTALWSSLFAYAAWKSVPIFALDVAEVARYMGWYAFLIAALAQNARVSAYWRYIALAAILSLGELAVVSLYSGPAGSATRDSANLYGMAGALGLAVVAMAMVERLYKGTRGGDRWTVKYLALALGAVFVYDFFMYADALLVRQIDPQLWQARGAVHALAMPLIAVSAARNPQWALHVHVSRRAVLGTASVTVAGGYLLAMAAAGYYIRLYGGAWGGPAQTIFLFAAALLLAILLFSGQLRAKARVFLSKHFFSYKYDYREEWLRFIKTLSGSADDGPLAERVIRAIAQPIESRGGILWQLRGTAYVPTATWNMPWQDLGAASEPADSPLVEALRDQEWVVERPEWRHDPDAYGVDAGHWLHRLPDGWLIVPLINEHTLVGFIVLDESRAGNEVNWEDRDLLKTAGRQAASFLAQQDAADELTRAKQFEAFSKLAAFVVHDLKNVISQLSMVTRNAERHKTNPAFIDDAMRTVDNSVQRMSRLMGQLRGVDNPETPERADIIAIVRDIAANNTDPGPVPQVAAERDRLAADIPTDRFGAIVEHLIQNAQEATGPNGAVKVEVACQPDGLLIAIEDDGQGMSQDFITNRLFKPFESTKGSKGMGIGAYEAKEFVENLGGRLAVRSEPGQGTRFELVFPSAILADEAAVTATEVAR